jgi:mRNA interferase RelE/StbE
LTYRVEFTKSAAKALRSIPRKDQKRIAKKIDQMTVALPSPETTKLKGNNPFHRVRVGNYRIIYEVNAGCLLILILKIGHRKDVYRHIY